MKSLDQLPSLAELKDLDSLNVEINFDEVRRSLAEARSGDGLVEETPSVDVATELAADTETAPEGHETAPTVVAPADNTSVH